MTAKQNFSLDGEPVLAYSVSLPEGPEHCKRLARYLQKTERVWMEYWEKKVYPAACGTLRERRAAARIFHPWAVSLVGETTWTDEGVMSIRMEAREIHGDGRPCVVRWGENWDVRADMPWDVENCFQPCKGWKNRVLEQIFQVGTARQRENLWIPDGDWRKKAKKALNTLSPWMDEKTIFWSFPQGFMADPAEGTPIFGTEREDLSQ